VPGPASLIVSIAQMAWSVVSDRRKPTAQPSVDSVARQVRISMREYEVPVPPGADRITDVVVTEIIRVVGESE
jgi:hypothetical protein